MPGAFSIAHGKSAGGTILRRLAAARKWGCSARSAPRSRDRRERGNPLVSTDVCAPFDIGRKQWCQTRLYECISEMKKGSPSGYDAETGEESAGSESSPGEPHEYPSLYRIRRSQENHQLLRGGRDRGRRQSAGATRRITAMGGGAAATVAGSAGSDPVQRLDLRHTEALQRAVVDRASRQSHQRGQEEERY